jgi:hypothetical protein
MGLAAISAGLASDMAEVRSDYNPPTSQEQAFYQQLDTALKKRLAEWAQMAKKPAAVSN